MRQLALVFTFLFLVFAANPAADAQDRYANLGFKTGEAFPDLVLPNVETGKPMSLSQFRGKKLLVLHFASW